MSQRVRRNGSPTSNCTPIPSSATSAVAGGNTTVGSSASGISAGVGLFSRLLPMKATVPFQLKAQTQPPLQTRSAHGTGSGGSTSPTHNNGNGKCHSSGCEVTGTRTSTSHSRSPTRAISSSASALPPSSPTCALHSNAVASSSSSSSSSSRSSPTITSYVSTSGSSGAPVRPPQALSPSPVSPQVTVASPHMNIHSYSYSNVNAILGVPPFASSSAGSPCCSPSQQLHWFSDNSVLTTSLQPPPFSASPSSSSSSSSSGGQRGRLLPPPPRWSPENDRLSPERISPSSPVCKERPRHPLAGPSSGGSSGSIRRTSSLDALTGPYLSGHWPRDASHAPCAPCMRDKATQTPSAWADECSEKRRGSHKRSASWGSTDQLKEIAKLRQQLQRSKHSSRHHRDKDHKSPFNGNHAAINQSQALVPKSILIPIPISKSSGSRFRNSVEGLNQEIERIIIRDTGEQDEQFIPQDIPDGHRAPPPLCPRSAYSRSVDTQTPSGGRAGGSHSNSSSRSQSVSPAFLAVPNDLGSESPCPSEELLTEGREKDLGPSSPLPKYASSPKPNNSYMFKREPPEGCERVKVFEETQAKPLREIPQFLCPDRNKVNFIPKSGSAFCLVGILRPLLPAQELGFRGSAGVGVGARSLSPVAVEPEQRVSRGTSTSSQQPPLPRHVEEPES